MAESLPAYSEREPLSRSQVVTIVDSIGPVSAVFMGVTRADLSRGSARIDSSSRCFWDQDGHRITATVIPIRGFVVERSNDPDPSIPPPL